MWKTVWLYVILGTTMMLLLGIVYSYSMFRLEIEQVYQVEAFLSGLPYMFSLFFYALFMAIGGRLYQSHNTKTIAIIGTVLIGGGFILAAFWQSIIGLVLAYGIMVGSGVGLLYALPLRIVSQLTYSRTGLLTGITLMGFGLSPLLFARIVQSLISNQGLSITFLVLGLVYLVLLSILLLPLSTRDQVPLIKERVRYPILQQPSFYMVYGLFFIGTFVGLTMIGFTGHIGVDVFALSESQVALYLGIFAILNGVGRPLFGYLNDTIGFVVSAAISFVIIILGSVLLLFTTHQVVLFLVAFILIYVTFGGWLALAPGATIALFGRSDYSKNYGLMFTAYGLAALLGNGTGGLLVETWSYSALFLMNIALATIGLLVLALKHSLVQHKTP